MDCVTVRMSDKQFQMYYFNKTTLPNSLRPGDAAKMTLLGSVNVSLSGLSRAI